MFLHTAMALLSLQVPSRHPTPSVTADALLKQVYRKYDTAETYDGVVTTTIKASNGQSTTVVHAQAEGDRRGSVAKSRIEILTAAGKRVSQLVRIDDGKDLWLVQPGSNGFTREKRKADKLSELLKPFFTAVERFAPALKVSTTRNRGLSTTIVTGRGRKGGSVRITLNGDSLALKDANAVLETGETMTLSVTEEVWNKPLSKSLFEFHPPPGARQLPAPRPGGVYGIPNTGKRIL